LLAYRASGCDRVQRWGGPIEEIRPGDAVWLAPGEKHWHGAAPLTAMTHVAIGEVLDAKSADWMEKVSNEPTKGGNPRKGAASIHYTKRDAEGRGIGNFRRDEVLRRQVCWQKSPLNEPDVFP
jgi:hypothetical protein